MNTYLAQQLAAGIHRDRIEDSDRRRRLAIVRREAKARRLARRANELSRRAAELVERTHR